MATDPIFVDTHVLIHARDDRASEKVRRAQARLLGLGARGTARVTLQVLDGMTPWILKNEPRRGATGIGHEIATPRIRGDRPLTGAEPGVAGPCAPRPAAMGATDFPAPRPACTAAATSSPRTWPMERPSRD